MNKVRLHELVWFPYRPEHWLLALIVILLLFALASFGVVKSVDIFTTYGSSKATANSWLITFVLLFLCWGLCIMGARSDYVVWYQALFPCLFTICLLSVIFWVLAGSSTKGGGSCDNSILSFCLCFARNRGSLSAIHWRRPGKSGAHLAKSKRRCFLAVANRCRPDRVCRPSIRLDGFT
jgi:hypothetical protein